MSAAGPSLEVDIGALHLKNPVLAASGTAGFGREYAHFAPLFGAIVAKSVTLGPRAGNPPPRLVETACGLLNSIGLENPGVEAFLRDELPAARGLGVPIVASIAGETAAEYGELARAVDRADGVAAIEVNISCPNVARGGMLFGADPVQAAAAVGAARAATRLPLIAKLTPNVTDVCAVARAVVDAGADAVALINTVAGMAIDAERRRPVLGGVFGGLSGPAIKPIALRMVWLVAEAIDRPVIGMGGICDARDAVEFILAGAAAVGVGTATFVDPGAAAGIVDGIRAYLVEAGARSLRDIIGAARRWRDEGRA
jgi:dihydroorotate dehydrogenase (NAD+) catalytic subunit